MRRSNQLVECPKSWTHAYYFLADYNKSGRVQENRKPQDSPYPRRFRTTKTLLNVQPIVRFDRGRKQKQDTVLLGSQDFPVIWNLDN